MHYPHLFFALVLWAICVQTPYAQDGNSPTSTTSPLPMRRNIIKINLLSPTMNSLHVGYERVLNDEMSFQLSTFIQDTQVLFGNAGAGFGWFGELRFYVSENRQAPSGFFVAPYVGNYNYNFNSRFPQMVGNVIVGYNEKTYKSRIATTGIIIGTQWTFKRRITLDIWGGPGYAFQLSSDKDFDWTGGFPYTNNGFIGRGGVTLGFAF